VEDHVARAQRLTGIVDRGIARDRQDRVIKLA
jgi:hypothetical protein